MVLKGYMRFKQGAQEGFSDPLIVIHFRASYLHFDPGCGVALTSCGVALKSMALPNLPAGAFFDKNHKAFYILNY